MTVFKRLISYMKINQQINQEPNKGSRFQPFWEAFVYERLKFSG